ncbi:MAG: hypothetical protein ACYCXD_09935, partial [Coriobacteriia bacterium]
MDLCLDTHPEDGHAETLKHWLYGCKLRLVNLICWQGEASQYLVFRGLTRQNLKALVHRFCHVNSYLGAIKRCSEALTVLASACGPLCLNADTPIPPASDDVVAGLRSLELLRDFPAKGFKSRTYYVDD